MDRALGDLIRISRAVGGDPSLVQGGGGNTSVKTADGRHMYIKASGTALKDLGQSRGWRRLRLDLVRGILEDGALRGLDDGRRESAVISRLSTACDDCVAGDIRPSVESHLHAFLGRCVVHLHPVAVGAFVSAKNGRAELERLFAADPLPPLWVPYADPGYKLAQRVRRLVGGYLRDHGRHPAVLFLEKHGLCVAAGTAAAALAEVRRVIAACERRLGPPSRAGAIRPRPKAVADLRLAIRRARFEAGGSYVAVQHFLDADIARFLGLPRARELLSFPALSPDEFAYANGPPIWLGGDRPRSLTGRLRRQLARQGRCATSFLAPGVGLFVAGGETTIPLVRDVVKASLAVRAGAARLGGVKALSPRQRAFISQWEMESFRKQVAGAAREGELAGRIAVVSGAGSGLGRSIALGLAGAGAAVALADVDLKSAEETAALARRQAPRASVAAFTCDVTGEREVEECYAGVLDRWGGLDILVNAAGVAPPYPLVDLPAAEWRRALEVNLTGYFLMARAAARVMIRQGMGGNIINLSSKSGLEASRSNTAYNATKAGEIHMARGWAVELGEHGIRVNSVAPGNVFEGSRIWSPKYIRECAKKYGIRPEEVIPHYVNMTALKREITGRDVANAVIFLCSEKARTVTGQTLVPDGGQVMVR